VRGADCIYVIKEGTTVEAGTHTELVERPNGVYRTLSQLQFHSSSPPPQENDSWPVPLLPGHPLPRP
jgi:hypothetical protein